MEFKLVTPEEHAQIQSPTGFNLGIAVEDNVICSMVSFDVSRRGDFCNRCTQHCAQGRIVWTRRGYREQGLFRSLYDWTVSELDLDKIYAGGEAIPVEGPAIWWNQGIVRPPGLEVDPVASYRTGEEWQLRYVSEISQILGYDLE